MTDLLRAMLEVWPQILLAAAVFDGIVYAIIGVAIWRRRRG